MSSEIRVNSLSSRAGLSTVTFTDTGPIFSGITTFQDNSGFNVGTGGSIFSPTSNTVTLGTNSAERLRIASNGNIGIGTDNPGSNKLQIQGSSAFYGNGGASATWGDTSYLGALSFDGSAQPVIRAASSKALIFQVNQSTEALRISSTSQIGMGKAGQVTPNGNSPLTIQESDSNSETICLRATNSGGNGSQPGIVMKTAGGGHIGGIYCDVNSDYMRISTSGTDRVYISDTGNVGVGVASPSQKFMVKGIIASEATNSTNNWMAYTHTDDTFRLNYNGAGDDEVVVTSGGNISIGGAAGRDFSLLDGIVTNTANGSAGLLINSSSSSHNAYLGFSYGSGSSTSHADQFSAYIGRVGDNTLILGTDNNIRARVTSGGDVLIGGQSAYTYDDTGATNTILDITNSNNNKRGILSLSGNSNANGPSIGTIWFNNDQNSGTGPGATMKLVAAIQAKAVTSDSNASDDSGAYLQFLTKPESAALAESMVIHSDGYVTKPKHPSFRVGRHNNYNHTGGQPVQFNTTTGSAHLNQGNHYSTTNHRFTAPVAGVYQFSACIIVNGIANNTDLTDLFYIYKNGNHMGYSMRRGRYVDGSTGTAGYYVDFLSNVNLLMAANDYCDIRVRLSLSVHGNATYTWFSGTLIG